MTFKFRRIMIRSNVDYMDLSIAFHLTALAFFGSRETRGFRLAKEANELEEKEGGESISIEGKKMCFLEMLL